MTELPLGQPSCPLLTASLIVKNEEKFLAECLESLRGVADEIVVLDTGSTDRTIEIARSGGARVFEFPWTGDFSAARNRALDLSTGEWILYIDADERVRPGSALNLQTELSDSAYAGHEILLHPRPGHTPYWALRLFRNDPSVRFRGVIHENIWPALSEYCARTGREISKSSLVLDHKGYEGNLEAKNARNLPLLRECLKQDPKHVYAWCHLAATYSEMEELELARDAWVSALEVVRSREQQKPEDILPYLALIHSDSGFDTKALLLEALAKFGPAVQLEWLRARQLMTEGQFECAIGVFQQLIERGKNRDYDQYIAHDPKLFGVLAYENIATCYFQLRHYAESRLYYDLAAKEDPGKLEYRVKRALCDRLERQASAATAMPVTS